MICYFIFGVIFGVFIIPLLDQFLNLILTALEAVKSRIGIDITQSNKTIRDIELFSKEEHSFTVGFDTKESEEK